ncbi:hypothetical protein A3Q56_01177 [Intoshia linei]|uniref:Homeobox domain-containing protein n=1 Tax=Intoshia linei TaxID=1819745 RepID=A0A177B9Q9_9BILA|nr:hypothetical protein A3Q56_01177 [Intoshia linei]
MTNESCNTISQFLSSEYQRYVATKKRIMGLNNNSLHMNYNVFTNSFISPLNYHHYNDTYSNIHQTLNRIHITINNNNTNNGKFATPIIDKSKIKNGHNKNAKEKNYNFFQIHNLCKSSIKIQNETTQVKCDNDPTKINKSDETSSSSRDLSPNKKATRLSSSSGKVKLFSPSVLQILSGWLGDHDNEPYANPMEVAQLSIITGLSKKQIRKWLANKRCRNRKIIKVVN